MWEPLTATGEPLRGLTAEQRVGVERAQAWAYYIIRGGGMIEHFDGYKWLEWSAGDWPMTKDGGASSRVDRDLLRRYLPNRRMAAQRRFLSFSQRASSASKRSRKPGFNVVLLCLFEIFVSWSPVTHSQAEADAPRSGRNAVEECPALAAMSRGTVRHGRREGRELRKSGE
jgi:hypothetical protein